MPKAAKALRHPTKVDSKETGYLWKRNESFLRLDVIKFLWKFVGSYAEDEEK